MKKLTPFLLSLLLFIGSVNIIKASHIPGANLTWSCNPANPLTYTFTFTEFVSCPSTLGSTASGFVFTNSCGLTNPTMGSMTQVGVAVDVSQTCGSVLSACAGGTVPGVLMYTYTQTVTFPANCDSWTIDYDLCCRDANSNTAGGAGNDMHVQSVMNTLTAPCNSGPSVTSQPIPYMCAGQNNTYCITTADPDADSTYFQMTSPLGSGGVPIAYNAPYTINSPMNGFVLNPFTGCMSFNQATIGNFVVAVLIQSYDASGNLISSIIHDFQFEIINCTNTPPNQPAGGTITNFSGSGGTQTGPASIEMCYGDNICFDVTFTDPNAANSLTITTNGTTIMPGATFTQTGTNPATGTFCWTAQPGFTGNVVTFVVEDDACPITGTNSFSVNFQINTGVFAGPDVYICGSQTAQLNATGASTYNWSPSTGLSCTNCPNPVASPTTTTTYTLTGNLTGTCPNTDQMTVFVEFPFNLTASATPTVVCPGGCTQLDAVLANLPPPCCTYSVELYDTFGDSWNGGQITVYVGGVAVAPAFTVSSGYGPVTYNFSVCNGAAITVTYVGGSWQSENQYTIYDSNGNIIFTDGMGGTVPTGGNAGTGSCGAVYNYGYSWTPTAGLSNPNIQNPTACGITGSTTYTATAYSISDPSCFTTASVNVNVSTVNAGTDVSICTGANTTLAATGISACGAGGSYSWSPAIGLSATNIANPVASPASTTTYTVSFTDGCGCVITDQVIVSVGASIPPTMASTPETCFGNNTGTATATPNGMTPTYTYSWNTIPVQTTNPATGLAPGNYTVTITDGNGCVASNSVNVAAGIVVTAGFTVNDNTQCLTGNSFVFTNTGSVGVYSWNFGDAGTSTAQNPSHTYAAAGTYVVTHTVTSGPCFATTTQNITVYPMPLPTSTSTPVGCFGGSNGTATVTTPISPGPGPFSYSWSPSAQLTNPATGLAAGSYTCTVTDQTTGCTGQTTVVVTQPTVLTASEVHVNPICNGFSNGTATATGAGGTPGYTYSWNTVPIQNTPTATGLAAGSYTCTITDANGCQTTVISTLVNPPGIVLNPTMTPANCGLPDGATNVTIVSGGVGPFTYSWNTIPVQTTAATANVPAGTYTVVVTDQANGCTQTASVTVTSTAGITANAVFISNALCNGSNDGLAYAFPTGGAPVYTYSWNTIPIQTNDTLIAGAGTYTVVITDGSGCTGNASVTINEPTPIIASITSFTNASCFGANDGTATAGGAGGTPGYIYSWNTIPVQNTQTATGLAPGTYTVTVTDGNGCTNTAPVTIIDGPLMTSSVVGTD
ncbi:MAG: hypothetical protein CO118_05225, partial [Flavobacteriales bacterium CG_4_9_14_3_um_filter_32_8]